jgi:hypothetical protein
MPSRAVSERREEAGPVTVVFVLALLLILTVGGVLFFAAADIARYLRIRRM